MGWQYSDGDPLMGAPKWPNARGYEKITIFDQYIGLYLGTDAR